uniref:Small ribosomal subunit protein uS3c n=1 Tax=Downingia elegans TaxID=104522 RepID=A0A1Z2QTD8_9ASTR|nr:ribosomal protein S3 [Downingia elegans]ASA34709.1 ribosomal protein S3 [Downingia elegans]
MGQKINPLGFRLGTTQKHYSLWFAQPKQYSENLQEDAKIREYIKNYLEENRKIYPSLEKIPRIEIAKQTDAIHIKLSTASPKFFTKILKPRGKKVLSKKETDESKELGLEEMLQNEFYQKLKSNLQKEFYVVNRKLKLYTKRIAEPYGNPTLLAEFIADQLNNRVSFRKAIKKAIDLAGQANAKGIRVQLAGRIDGKDIARVEWFREGRVPLQTIQAKIDYCSYPIRTLSGILGLKIWIFIDPQENGPFVLVGNELKNKKAISSFPNEKI